MTDSTNNANLVTLAIITSVHGVRGEVKIKPYTEYPEDITAYGDITNEDGSRSFTITLTGNENAKGQLIARIDGITDRNAAEKLRGTKLCVPRDRLPEPDKSEFYIEDLIGVTAYLEDGAEYGEIKHVHNFGAGDLVEIAPVNGGKVEYFAFNDKTFPAIDMAERKITLAPPELINASQDEAYKDKKRNQESAIET